MTADSQPLSRPASGELALLVGVSWPGGPSGPDLGELRQLATGAGARVKAAVSARRDRPDPRYLVGSGKAHEIADQVAEHGIELVIFDCALSPAQERNLERLLRCRVLDRTGLILDIFARRARSHEGKLQVELAQLRHLSTRLVRGWTHLERQKGGIGLRGPGETQLETDRRLIGTRIRQLSRRLERVDRQRQLGRRARRRAEMPTVSLVGYTNAGKSTLFNRLSGADVHAADQLFATLDPTLRRVRVAGAGDFVLADTVGFVRDLPHELVAAFRSTLQETVEADLLLHVVDCSDPDLRERMAEVDSVLEAVGAAGVPRLEVFNKTDLLSDPPHGRLDTDDKGSPRRVWVSAGSGAGVDRLLEAVADRLTPGRLHGWVHLGCSEGRLRATLFEMGAIRDERLDDRGGWFLELQGSPERLGRLMAREGLAWAAPAP